LVTAFKEAFPILYSDDVGRAADFYRSTFGFEQSFRWPAEGDELEFVFLRLPPLGIGIAKRQPIGDEDFQLCIYTDDLDAAAERLRAAGAEEVQPPQDMPWGERLTYFHDLDGNLLHVTMPL
jgi:lactoylglutathione lyase